MNRKRKKLIDACEGTYIYLLEKCPRYEKQIEALMRMSYAIGKEVQGVNVELFKGVDTDEKVN